MKKQQRAVNDRIAFETLHGAALKLSEFAVNFEGGGTDEENKNDISTHQANNLDGTEDNLLGLTNIMDTSQLESPAEPKIGVHGQIQFKIDNFSNVNESYKTPTISAEETPMEYRRRIYKNVTQKSSRVDLDKQLLDKKSGEFTNSISNVQYPKGLVRNDTMKTAQEKKQLLMMKGPSTGLNSSNKNKSQPSVHEEKQVKEAKGKSVGKKSLSAWSYSNFKPSKTLKENPINLIKNGDISIGSNEKINNNQFSLKNFNEALATKVSQMSRAQKFQHLIPIGEQADSLKEDGDKIQLKKRQRRHQVESDFDFNSYQITLQEQQQNNSSKAYILYRRSGKQKLPKVLKDFTNRERRNQKILKKVFVQQKIKQEDGNNSDYSENNNIDTMKEEANSNDEQVPHQDSFIDEEETSSEYSDDGLDDDISSDLSEPDVAGLSEVQAKIKLRDYTTQKAIRRKAKIKEKRQEQFRIEAENDGSNHDSDFDEIHHETMLGVVTEEDCCVLQPDSCVRGTWDLILFLALVYQSFTLPMVIAFEIKSTDFTFYLGMVIDSMFIMDMFLNFNTGFYDKGVKYMKRSQICADYFALWFWIDIVSTIPYTWILAWSQGLSIKDIESDDSVLTKKAAAGRLNITQNVTSKVKKNAIPAALTDAPQLLRLLKIAKLLKMLKLLRVMKVKKLLLKFEENIVSDSMDLMLTFVKIIIQILIIAHYMSCVFFYIGMEEIRGERTSWILDKSLDDKEFGEQYITSMYWAITTMAAVGYGEIVPKTETERVVCLIMMMFSCGIFAYTVNSIGNIVSRFNRIATSFREKMMYVNMYFSQKNMPLELRNKVRRYLDYVFEVKQDIKVNEKEVYLLLNERLKEKLQMHLRGRVLSGISMFQPFGLDYLSEMTSYFHSQTFVIDDFIFVENDKSECLYTIVEGKVAMIHKKTHTFFKDLKKDQYFGEMGALTNEARIMSAKARDFTQVYRIMSKDLFAMSEQFTKAFKALKKIRDDLSKGSYESVCTTCYLCNEKDHLALQCRKFSTKWKGNLIQNKENENQKVEAIVEQQKQLEELKRSLFNNKKIPSKKKKSIEGQKLYQSSDSEVSINIKDELIKKAINNKSNLKNGTLMHFIIEYPKNVQSFIEEENNQETQLSYNIFNKNNSNNTLSLQKKMTSTIESKLNKQSTDNSPIKTNTKGSNKLLTSKSSNDQSSSEQSEEKDIILVQNEFQPVQEVDDESSNMHNSRNTKKQRDSESSNKESSQDKQVIQIKQLKFEQNISEPELIQSKSSKSKSSSSVSIISKNPDDQKSSQIITQEKQDSSSQKSLVQQLIQKDKEIEIKEADYFRQSEEDLIQLGDYSNQQKIQKTVAVEVQTSLNAQNFTDALNQGMNRSRQTEHKIETEPVTLRANQNSQAFKSGQNMQTDTNNTEKVEGFNAIIKVPKASNVDIERTSFVSFEQSSVQKEETGPRVIRMQEEQKSENDNLQQNSPSNSNSSVDQGTGTYSRWDTNNQQQENEDEVKEQAQNDLEELEDELEKLEQEVVENFSKVKKQKRKAKSKKKKKKLPQALQTIKDVYKTGKQNPTFSARNFYQITEEEISERPNYSKNASTYSGHPTKFIPVRQKVLMNSRPISRQSDNNIAQKKISNFNEIKRPGTTHKIDEPQMIYKRIISKTQPNFFKSASKRRKKVETLSPIADRSKTGALTGKNPYLFIGKLQNSKAEKRTRKSHSTNLDDRKNTKTEVQDVIAEEKREEIMRTTQINSSLSGSAMKAEKLFEVSDKNTRMRT